MLQLSFLFLIVRVQSFSYEIIHKGNSGIRRNSLHLVVRHIVYSNIRSSSSRRVERNVPESHNSSIWRAVFYPGSSGSSIGRNDPDTHNSSIRRAVFYPGSSGSSIGRNNPDSHNSSIWRAVFYPGSSGSSIGRNDPDTHNSSIGRAVFYPDSSGSSIGRNALFPGKGKGWGDRTNFLPLAACIPDPTGASNSLFSTRLS